MFERDLTLFTEHLVAVRGLSRNTTGAYLSDLHEFREFLEGTGVTSWREVDRDLVLDYLDGEREKGMQTATLARRLVSIKMFFRFLHEEGLISEDFTAVMDSPKLWRILPDFLSEREVDTLLAAYPNSAKFPLEMRNRAILELLYASGLRVSEAAKLPLTGVDFDNELLRVVGNPNHALMEALPHRLDDVGELLIGEGHGKLAGALFDGIQELRASEQANFRILLLHFQFLLFDLYFGSCIGHWTHRMHG